MKKLAVFIFVGFLALLGTIIPKDNLFNIQNVGSYTFVLSAQTAMDEGLEFTENGFDAIVTVRDTKKAKEIYEKHSPKCLIMSFDKGQFDYVKEYLGISQSFTQQLQDLQILYGYTSFYPESELIEGKKVNVQMVIRGQELIVGFPIIMTGY